MLKVRQACWGAEVALVTSKSQTPHATPYLQASTEGQDYWATGSYNDDKIAFTRSSFDIGNKTQLYDYGRPLAAPDHAPCDQGPGAPLHYGRAC